MRNSTRIGALLVCALLVTGFAFAGGGTETSAPAVTKATGVQLPVNEIMAKYNPEITITFGGR